MHHQWVTAIAIATAASWAAPSAAAAAAPSGPGAPSVGASTAAPSWKPSYKASNATDMAQLEPTFSNASIAREALATSSAGSPLAGDRYRATRSAAMKWELAYLALGVVDTVQTIGCLHRNVCEEANPIFGKHPKGATLIAAKAGIGLLHFAAFSILNRRAPNYALRVAQISAITQGSVVALNARIAF
jgi:hypothetical protein